ncbi:MICOS complex subunit mic60 [Thecaphora frezii]
MISRAATLSRVSTRSARRSPAASARTYVTEIIKPRRSLPTRLAVWTTVGGVAFYGVSTVAALNNDRYQDFFVETVPFGERIIDYLDTHDVGQEIKSVNLGGYPSRAIDLTKNAYSTISDAVSRVASGSEAPTPGERDARTQLAEARERAKAGAAKLADKAHDAGDTAKKEAEAAVKTVQDNAAHLVEKAKATAERAEAKVRSEAGASNGDDRGVLKKAFDSVQIMTDIGANNKASPTKSRAPTTPGGEVKAPYQGELPVNHEPPVGYVAPRRDRGLEAPKDSTARLRPDPEAPKLPLLAPSIKSLSGSEPMIAQLADTIDELTVFLKETPSSGAKAKGVLESAQIDLEQLSKRLESIKREEAKRVEASLASQAKRYEAQISQQAEEAANKLSSREADWQKTFDEERAKQLDEFKAKLNAELATQSQIINERLKEEVIAQGIELQRRWMKEIRAKVEEERGGRLAKLDELATELKGLEKVTLDNSHQLDENVNVHTLWTAVRAVRSAVEDETSKRPFSDELRVLRNTAKAREEGVIRTALEVVDASRAAEEGVESFTTLQQWFHDKVGPKIRSVALVPSPERAGVLSHAASALLSPLLFQKKGLVEGDDVTSVLARTEYYLDRKDLDAAARQLNQLQGWPKRLAADWLAAARKRLEVQQALDVVNTQASLASLMVVGK